MERTCDLKELRSLVELESEPKVSLYVPQRAEFPAAAENSKQLRHALFGAETKLKEAGCDATQISSLLEPALDLVRDEASLRESGTEGLAVLLAPGVFRQWQLPFPCEPTVDVGPDFRISPLVRLAHWPVQLRIVALSANRVQFYECTRDDIRELELPPGTPTSLESFEWGPDVGRPVRFQTAAGTRGTTQLIHGQASAKEEAQTRLHAYVQAVAHVIGKATSKDALSLILVAVKELHPIFRDAYLPRNLVAPGIDASPAHLSTAQVHEQVIQLVDTNGIGELDRARQHYKSALETHHATSKLEEIVVAAGEGQVDTLIAACDARVWGLWQPDQKRALIMGPTAQSRTVDLLDLAVRETLRHGGHVCVVSRSQVPQQAEAVAGLRWTSSEKRG